MKRILMYALLMTIVATLSAPVSAQDTGRPDPTGQGRYMMFGSESSYGRAHVAKELPAGATCAPAGEMVGARVWNSTKEGFAILSELSDKAEIATTQGGEVFLCHCARGYNQLFLMTPTSAPSVADEFAKPEPAIGPQGPPGPPGLPGLPGRNGTGCYVEVRADHSTWQVCGKSEVLLNRPMSRGKKAIIGGVVAATAAGVYLVGRQLCWWVRR